VASPTNPLAHYRLAIAQYLAKDRDGSLKSLDKALGLRPDFSDASIQKALLLGQMGRTEEGIRIARSLQAQEPKRAGGYMVEAEILHNTKKYLDAGKLFLKAAQLSMRGQTMLRAYQAFVAGGQAAEGEKQLTLWLNAHPEDTPVRHALAQALLNSKRLPEAIGQYQILVRANPSDLVALNNLAWMLGASNIPEALKMAEKAYKVAPNNAAVLDTLGWLLTQTGQVQRALPHLRAAIKQVPENPEIRWHLALALEKAGDTREAALELDRLLTSRNEFPQAEQAREKLRALRGTTQ
jgi:putative PEP-CTERM system TPR-repeat lipoprotein